MNDIEMPHIKVPEDWDTAKDLHYFDAKFGIIGDDIDLESIVSDALSLIGIAVEQLNDVLQRALLELYEDEFDEEAVIVMSPEGKIKVLREECLLRLAESTRQFTLPHLLACERALALKDQILTRYVRNRQGIWLYELGEVNEWIVKAWVDLVESLNDAFGWELDWAP